MRLFSCTVTNMVTVLIHLLRLAEFSGKIALAQKCANVQNYAKLGLLIEKFLKEKVEILIITILINLTTQH